MNLRSRPGILLIFAKAPEPGRVKTRLARTLGDVEAARIYRALGRNVVDQVRHGDYRSVVYFDPPDAEAAFRAWLGAEALEFTPQPRGDLGDRLGYAFEWGFRQAEHVGVVGTDAPDLDRSLVEAAFARLRDPEGPDAVFGPAEDGGYYLLALRRRLPSLFRGIPWSTDRVLERSLARVRAAGGRVELLKPLTDVDRVEDVPEELRS